MDTTVLAVINVSKKYVLLPEQARIGYTFKELIVDTITAGKKKMFQSIPHIKEDFWALEDISFTVSKGEVLGIIGPNGAGKSTLLRLLSEVTKPTKGEIRVNEKVTSLLEIGSGFHPDLTGRENVFFHGSIIGLRRGEIEKKFDEIVSFADVWKFIDVPLKYYSAGMTARLSFAVALFLKPEILVIDEALVVGDAKFQKKCFRHFAQLAESGVTIVITSHDMSLITKMATRCLYLHQGKVRAIGKPGAVIQEYLANGNKESIELTKRVGDSLIEIKKQYKKLLQTNLHDWLIYHQERIHFAKTSWMGIETLKNPLDAWIYQEILFEVRPDTVIEIGSFHGGSSLYIANVMDAIGHGNVISIEIDPALHKVSHPRIQLLVGDSTKNEMVKKVWEICQDKKVLIIHDGNHDSAVVLADLNHYSPLVTKGSYFIVEDGIIDLFTSEDAIGSPHPGPLAAITEFLANHPEFAADQERERYMITYNPSGFLKKID